MDKEKSIDDLKMSGCLDTGDYDDDLMTFIVCKQNTPVTSSIRIFEKAYFCQLSEIVSITGRDIILKQDILIEDCSGNCSQISYWRLQKPESPIMAVLSWQKNNLLKY